MYQDLFKGRNIDLADLLDDYPAIYDCFPDEFKIINVGTGRGVSILDLCNIVTSIASELGFQPVDVSRAPAREGDVDHSVADTSELELILSIKDLKPLSLGIKEQIISEFGKRKKIDVRGN